MPKNIATCVSSQSGCNIRHFWPQQSQKRQRNPGGTDKLSIAVFTSRDEKCEGELSENDTSEVNYSQL